MNSLESNLLRKFYPPFFIGSAASAFQMEDPLHSCGRKTDWDPFLRKYHIVKPGEIGPDWGDLTKFKKDIGEMGDLGMEAQRLSIEWGRVEPEKGKINKEALQHYRKQVDFVRNKEMIPILTLNHFVLPKWVAEQGGWESPKIVPAFRNWSSRVASEFGDVPYFVTINEPNTLLGASYQQGYWPPEKRSLISLLRGLYHMKNAHHQAYEVIKNQSPKANVGVSNLVMWLQPDNPHDLRDRGISNFGNLIMNKLFPILTRHDTDFLGLGFYTGFNIKFKPTLRTAMRDDALAAPKTIPGGETVRPEGYNSNLGWPAVPHFFLDVLTTMYQQFHKPIIITENGFSDPEDQYTSYYTLTHLVALQEAMQRGVDIRGYLHWATIDNLEFREGYKARFGLLSLNSETGQRQIRRSAGLLGEIARTHEIDLSKLIPKYLPPEQRVQAIKTIKFLGHAGQ